MGNMLTPRVVNRDERINVIISNIKEKRMIEDIDRRRTLIKMNTLEKTMQRLIRKHTVKDYYAYQIEDLRQVIP